MNNIFKTTVENHLVKLFDQGCMVHRITINPSMLDNLNPARMIEAASNGNPMWVSDFGNIELVLDPNYPQEYAGFYSTPSF